LVADEYEELLAEADILRQELGILIKDLREFLFNASKDSDLDKEDLITGIREIVDGR
jgi:hypothetical protein